jgi:hypothetical protein
VGGTGNLSYAKCGCPRIGATTSRALLMHNHISKLTLAQDRFSLVQPLLRPIDINNCKVFQY